MKEKTREEKIEEIKEGIIWEKYFLRVVVFIGFFYGYLGYLGSLNSIERIDVVPLILLGCLAIYSGLNAVGFFRDEDKLKRLEKLG